MKTTWIAAAGLAGACAICCAPLIIGGVTALTAGLSAWAGLSVAQIAGVALLVLALGFFGFFGLRRRRADCACETACSIETCEKP